MNDLDYKNLACNARVLYELTRHMQKNLLELFVDEFTRLDEEEIKANRQCQEPPF